MHVYETYINREGIVPSLAVQRGQSAASVAEGKQCLVSRMGLTNKPRKKLSPNGRYGLYADSAHH
jgi:hypothetical protein